MTRAMTFNIHNGVGVDGGLDLDRVAATVAAHQPDVVGLQKVDRHWSGRRGFVDKVRVLARRHRHAARVRRCRGC